MLSIAGGIILGGLGLVASYILLALLLMRIFRRSR